MREDGHTGDVGETASDAEADPLRQEDLGRLRESEDGEARCTRHT